MKTRSRLAWLVFALALLLPETLTRQPSAPEATAPPVAETIRLLAGGEVLPHALEGEAGGEFPVLFVEYLIFLQKTFLYPSLHKRSPRVPSTQA